MEVISQPPEHSSTRSTCHTAAGRIVGMDTERYLARIGLGSVPSTDLEGLEVLQRAHLTAVPFENLHIYQRRTVSTALDWSVPKIVDERRGGWCFELNGAFSALLAELGFSVTRLAATVLHGNPSPIPTHLAIEVNIDRPYLVDVGFGDSFIRPLPLDSTGPHDGGTGHYAFSVAGETTTLTSHDKDGETTEHYRFNRTPRALADFEEASTYLQTQPGLQWTASPFATRLLDGGPDRVTLLRDRIKFRRNGSWVEEEVSERDWATRLDEWFGLRA
jgi:N-hydroxyarylamine O-acetyltransferase